MTAYRLGSLGDAGVSAFAARKGRSLGAGQHYAALHNPVGLPLAEADTLALVAFRDEAELVEKGGRLAYTRDTYYLPATAKAPLVDGPFGIGKGIGPTTATENMRLPVDGLFPRDQWEMAVWIRSVGADFTANTSAGAIWEARTAVLSDLVALRKASGINSTLGLVTRGWTATIALYVTITPAVGEIPADTWVCVTCKYKANSLTIMLGNNVRTATLGGFTPPVLPFGGDSNLFVGHHPEVASGMAGLNIAFPHPRRHARTYGQTLVYEGPTVTVDAGDTLGDFPREAGGVLYQHPGWRGTGFDGASGGGGLTPTSIRDQAVAETVAAGMPLVRIEWPLNHVTITGSSPSFAYDYGALDEHMDAAGDVDFHITIGHVPSILGTAESMPSSVSDFALIASAVLGHVKARYGAGRIRYLTLLNEPLLTTGQYTTVWAAVQAKLATDHPDLPAIGGPDDGFTPCMTAAIDYAEANALPFGLCGLHNYEDTPIGVAREIAIARAYLDAAGLTSSPIGLTEWNNDQGYGNERHGTLASLAKRRNRHRDEYNAALSYAKLCEMVTAGAVTGAFTRLVILDNGAVGENNEREMGLFANQDPIAPLAVYAALQAFWMHSGERIPVSCSFPFQRALGSVSDDGVMTLSYGNFRPYDGRELIAVSLKWDRPLPESFTWEQRRLDHRDAADGRLVLVAAGDETNLPGRTELAALGVGCIQITPS